MLKLLDLLAPLCWRCGIYRYGAEAPAWLLFAPRGFRVPLPILAKQNGGKTNSLFSLREGTG
jgi:hypothetical protein